MKSRTKVATVIGIIFATVAGGGVAAQTDASASLRASGSVGEQYDGYLGVVGDANANIRDQVSAINIKRRAFYTELARQRGATIQEVAVATACDLLRRKVGQGDHYKLPDGEWRKREGDIALPSYCG